MDLIFEPQRGRPFLIEVGYFDTVLEIKEKIAKYQGIPVHMQTLIFNGQTLQDDADIEKCVLLNASHVQLHIDPDFFRILNMEEFSPAPSTVKLSVKVTTPSSKIRTLEMDANDTVSRLKERIKEIEAIPIHNELVAHLSGNELHDGRMLVDCGIWQCSVIHVSLRPLPVAAETGNGNNGAGGSKNLRVTVVSSCGKRMISIPVNPSDNVGELRKDLERLQRRDQFPLPSDGYFFIHAQSVMEEDQSFEWHQVAHFDTIEIFRGSVTSGAP